MSDERTLVHDIRKAIVLLFFTVVVLFFVTIAFQVYTKRDLSNASKQTHQVEVDSQARIYNAALLACKTAMTNRAASNRTAVVVKKFLGVASRGRLRAARQFHLTGNRSQERINLLAAHAEQALADSFATLPIKRCTEIVPTP